MYQFNLETITDRTKILTIAPALFVSQPVFMTSLENCFIFKSVNEAIMFVIKKVKETDTNTFTSCEINNLHTKDVIISFDTRNGKRYNIKTLESYNYTENAHSYYDDYNKKCDEEVIALLDGNYNHYQEMIKTKEVLFVIEMSNLKNISRKNDRRIFKMLDRYFQDSWEDYSFSYSPTGRNTIEFVIHILFKDGYVEHLNLPSLDINLYN